MFALVAWCMSFYLNIDACRRRRALSRGEQPSRASANKTKQSETNKKITQKIAERQANLSLDVVHLIASCIFSLLLANVSGILTCRSIGRVIVSSYIFFFSPFFSCFLCHICRVTLCMMSCDLRAVAHNTRTST